MNGIIRFLPLGLASVLCWSGSLFADYTLVLKNGRRITVQSYREEGEMIKFPGLGGEIGITKDQIKSILKDGESEGRGMDLPRAGQKGKTGASPVPAEEAKVEKKGESPAEAKKKALSPKEKRAEKRAKEEKEYQSKFKEITEQIRSAKARYYQAKGGNDGPEPSLPESSKEAPADRSSRIMDSLQLPRWTYSPKEAELSDLRKRINQLEKERDKLIEEMKQKNL
ncbi:MAG: hypothetical protein O7B35_18995 [Deltaproteobacteria bacterium]|nr:hypothetical protein [Deltaproteobacteria bacterium]